ncbi:MAG TPA: hypothetical protein VHI13_12690 [Candidatus Kapabacteria bacterium]|nr:hypothetical protein [Candidatus Kapabacteria bacterium]
MKFSQMCQHRLRDMNATIEHNVDELQPVQGAESARGIEGGGIIRRDRDMCLEPAREFHRLPELVATKRPGRNAGPFRTR